MESVISGRKMEKKVCAVAVMVFFLLLSAPGVDAGSWGKLVPLAGGELLVSEGAMLVESVHLGSGLQPGLLVFLVALFILSFYGMQRRFALKHSFPLTAIFLLILLPVYSAEVYAGITPVRISGEDGFIRDMQTGYRKYADAVTIEVLVDIPGDDAISSEQVTFRMGYSGAQMIGECTGGASATCTYTTPIMTSSNDMVFIVSVYDDASVGNPARVSVADRSMNVITDTAGPDISVSTDRTIIGIEGTLTLTYHVKDVSKPGGNCGVGINEIKIFDGDFSGTVVHTVPGDGECEKSGTFEITSSGSGAQTRQFCVMATDLFGKSTQSLSDCIVFKEDNEPPVIENVELLNARGDELTHFGPGKTNFRLRVNISGDLLPDSVAIDLTALGLGVRKPSAGKIATGWMLTYEGIAIVSSDVSVTLPIVGNDEAGNQITPSSISKGTIYWDDIGPRFTSITSSDGTESGYLIIGSDSVITARIEDSYLLPEDIRLAMTQGAGGEEATGPTRAIAADSCKKIGSAWECNWSMGGVSLPDGIYAVAGHSGSRDYFGNLLDSTVEANANVDTTPPHIINATIRAVHHDAERFGDEVVKGDGVFIQIYINDSSSSVSAVTDLSSIITSLDGPVDFVCTDNSDPESDFVCTYESGSARIDVALIWAAAVNVTDRHGNLAQPSVGLMVSGWMDEENINYWSFEEMICSPRLIDRQVTTLTTQMQYCSVKLKGTTADILSIALVDCMNTTSVPMTPYVKAPELILSDDMTNPWIKFEFKNQNINVTEIPVECTLLIHSKVEVDGKWYVLTQSENETVPVTFQFYNNPLGTMDKNIEDDIKSAYDAATGSIFEIVSSLQSLLDVVTKICGIIQGLMAIPKAWFLLSMTKEKLATATSANPALSEKFAQTATKDCVTANEMQDLANEKYAGWFVPICNWANCRHAPTKEDARENTPSGILSKFTGFLNDWQEKGGSLWEDPTSSNKSFQDSWYAMGVTDPKNQLDVRDNLIMSLAYGCIPGIIYGVEKYRQIQCMYAYCLNNSGKAGFDRSMCDDLKSYSECMFVVGEVVYGLPWTAALAMWSDKLASLISNPFALMGLVFEYNCKGSCMLAGNAKGVEISWWCRSYEVASMLSVAIAELMTIIDSDEWDTEVDFCELMEGKDSGGFSLF